MLHFAFCNSMRSLIFRGLLICVSLHWAACVAVSVHAQDLPAFKLRLDKDAFSEPFSGDLFVAFSRAGEPREFMHQWFGAPPLLRFDVSDVALDHQVTLSMEDAAARFPADWSEVIGKEWNVQAVARVNKVSRMAGRGAGDVYGTVVSVQLEGGDAVELELNHVVAAEGFEETERIRLFTMESPSLSEFFGFSYQIQAGVMLPEVYDPDKTYPVVYDITGFGGTHQNIHRKLSRMAEDSYLNQCIVVIPDPSNRYGHSVFCNSRSIGPWGDALVRDMIPQLEEKFGGAGPEHRYVTGVSSGGWSCLYLQITYPTGVCWLLEPCSGSYRLPRFSTDQSLRASAWRQISEYV